ncbi:MAG: D-aminoacylase [Eubacteriales bacterium]|nr:D-aminoacylase [Eubacteriales bacterium]
MYELVIKNGSIIDGSGTESYQADIGINGEKIAKIGKIEESEAISCLDAKDLVVAPGFIDAHSHSDVDVVNMPFVPNKIRQGITTEIAGHCGISLFPVSKGSTGVIETVLKILNKNYPVDWFSTADYFKKVEKAGLGFNYLPLVGHGILRANAAGFAARKATRKELEIMKKLLEECLKLGVKGFSTGLEYAPGCFSDPEEIIELGKITALYNGVYTSHLREQGDKLLESVAEALEVGKRTGVTVVISHLKASWKKNWGKVSQALELMDEARNQGIKVYCDFYPYTYAASTLTHELPHWLNEGGMEKYLERLKSKEIRSRVTAEMEKSGEVNWEKVIISEVKTSGNKSLEGRSIVEIAAILKKSPYDAVFDLLIEEEGAVQVLSEIMCEEDVQTVALYRYSVLCSDAFTVSDNFIDFKGHPRYFGAFPRFLKKHVREKKLLTWPEAVHKISGAVAQIYGIKNRGLIKEGYYADLTIFDRDLIGDEASYKRPRAYPTGIKCVFVNGKMQVADNRLLHVPAGKILLSE